MSIDIQSLSGQLADIVETAGRSLVAVGCGRRRATGTVFDDQGHILTAARLVRRGKGVRVRIGDEDAGRARVVGVDPTTDLALLALDDAELAPPTWGDASELRVGHLVLTLGRPGGNPRATLGLLSALGPAWRTPFGGAVDRYIEVDGRLPRGYSGGLLVDLSGQAIGVNTRSLMRGGTTLPAPTLRRVVAGLASDGRIRRGYLGVVVQPVRLAADLAEELDQPMGLIVTSVEPDSAAEASGLLLGDTLIRLGDEPVESVDSLMGLLYNRAGDELSATVVRAGRVEELTLTVGERGKGADE